MTTIHVKENTWKKLNNLKKPGETMDDVIHKILEIVQEGSSILDDSDDVSFDELLDEFCTIAEKELQTVISASKQSFQRGRKSER